MTLALRARSLMKRYRAGFASAQSSIDALRGLDLDVADGELLGLLGPNGAGKSTFLLCAAGLLVPDSGTLEWFGRPAWPGGRPAGIAYVPERSFYHRFLTVREALEFYATLHELPGRERAARVRAALERVGMIEHAEKRISQLSRGMLQRLGIAQAVIGRPRIILLDETLSGLDPLAARDARALLRALRDEGTTIILSSHDLLSHPSLHGSSARVGPAPVSTARSCTCRSGTPPPSTYSATVGTWASSFAPRACAATTSSSASSISSSPPHASRSRTHDTSRVQVTGGGSGAGRVARREERAAFMVGASGGRRLRRRASHRRRDRIPRSRQEPLRDLRRKPSAARARARPRAPHGADGLPSADRADASRARRGGMGRRGKARA
ncbi:MAG: ABC transporter ATP-binding protein [Gemmatimonadaceae bacterium]|nr:ABC transporter ATP-binding protein [Gemmatimonadaceae bacterium]